MNGKKVECSKASYSLISAPLSTTNDARLDTLRLEVKDGNPCLLWCVSWRGGGSHADGTGAYEPIPDHVMADLTPEALWNWMAHWKVHIGDLIDRDTFVRDTDIRQKCVLFRESTVAAAMQK